MNIRDLVNQSEKDTDATLDIPEGKFVDYEGRQPKGFLNPYSRDSIEQILSDVSRKIKIFNKGAGQLNMDDFWHLKAIINDLSGIFADGIGKDTDGGFEKVLDTLNKCKKELSK